MKKLRYTIIAIALCLSTTLWTGCKDKEELPGKLHGVVIDKAMGAPVRVVGVALRSKSQKTVPLSKYTDIVYGMGEVCIGFI